MKKYMCVKVTANHDEIVFCIIIEKGLCLGGKIYKKNSYI
jgi:hypothetical protein